MYLHVLLNKNISIIFILFFIPFSVLSKNTISLTVIDKIDGSALENIKINIGNDIIYTNEKGIVTVNPSKLPITISINDFRYYSKEIELDNFRNKTI